MQVKTQLRATTTSLLAIVRVFATLVVTQISSLGYKLVLPTIPAVTTSLLAAVLVVATTVIIMCSLVAELVATTPLDATTFLLA